MTRDELERLMYAALTEQTTKLLCADETDRNGMPSPMAAALDAMAAKGLAVVPREATEEMAEEGVRARPASARFEGDTQEWREITIYRAMIAEGNLLGKEK